MVLLPVETSNGYVMVRNTLGNTNEDGLSRCTVESSFAEHRNFVAQVTGLLKLFTESICPKKNCNVLLVEAIMGFRLPSSARGVEPTHRET